MNPKTKRLVLGGMFTALILLLGLTPLGYPPIGLLKVTIVQVPVAIGAMVLGPWYGLFFGLLFGLTSMFQAAIGGLPTAPLFLDFRIALLPRLMVPLVALGVFLLCQKLFKGKNRWLGGTIAGVAASLTNTALVLTAINLVYGAQAAVMFGVAPQTFTTVLWGIAASSGLPEAAVCGFLCGILMSALKLMQRGEPHASRD